MAKKKKSGKAKPPAVRKDTAIPDYVKRGDRAGFENVDTADYLFPRAVLMQPLSPAVQEERFSAGDIVNSLTEEILVAKNETVEIVPVLFWKEWIEWRARSEGGGILDRSRDPQGTLAQRAAAGETRVEKNEAGADQEVRAVRDYMVFLVQPLRADGTADPRDMICLSCAKTNLKHARKLLTLARLRGEVPLFAGKYTFGSQLEENKRISVKYWAFSFTNAGWTSAEIYKVCAKSHIDMATHAAADRSTPDEEETAPTDSEV